MVEERAFEGVLCCCIASLLLLHATAGWPEARKGPFLLTCGNIDSILCRTPPLP